MAGDMARSSAHELPVRAGAPWWVRLYGWACQRLYHELAWGYDWVSLAVSVGRWPLWRQRVLHHLEAGASDQRPNLRILELGFGTGELLLALAGRGFPVTGLEPSAAMHAVTARKLERAQRPVACVQGVAQAQPFAGATFDRIVSTFPAAYIMDERTLAECARLLAEEGQLIVVGLWVRLRPRWLGALVPLFYGEPAPTQKLEIEARLARAGFAIDWREQVDGPFAVAVLIGRKVR